MRIRDGKNSDPVSGTEKLRIRDKHPGSATLQMLYRRRESARIKKWKRVAEDSTKKLPHSMHSSKPLLPHCHLEGFPTATWTFYENLHRVRKGHHHLNTGM
jgi:hypothetical protein